MTDYLDSLTQNTLSGRPYQQIDASNIEFEKFISYLGEVYATTFVELFIDGAVDSGKDNLQAEFDQVLRDVGSACSGGDVQATLGNNRTAYSVWGLVMLDKLVNSLDKDGETLSAMWLFSDVVDARTEALGEWVQVVGRQSFASSGGKKKYEAHLNAKQFVQGEWKTHKSSYGGNKSAFSRDFARRVANEYSVRVTEKTIREIWLSDTPTAGSRAG
ncbi:hypothetical protein [Polaromonas sp.]|uniref:hypothetical protein n=1 Tax=Polaromonas sp. TaxID=1869339 RepID=UPI003CA43F48